MNQTQIVSGPHGWIGAAGIAALFFSLVVLWAVNDKYAFIALQLQLVNDQLAEAREDRKRMEDRIGILELQEQGRTKRELGR
jgi:hypothetical protein